MGTISVKFRGGKSVEFRAPEREEWHRYISKLFRGEDIVARRELVQCCAASCSPEEAAKVLAANPASIKRIADALDSLAGGDEEVKVGEETVQACGLTFRAPTLDEWEDSQRDMAKDPGPNMEALLTSLCEGGDAAKVFAQLPAVPARVLHGVSSLVGANAEITVKKG